MAITPRLTTPRLVPTAIGVLNAGGLVGGAVLPWLAGVIAQGTGIWTLLPFSIALGVIQLAVWRPVAARSRVGAPACRRWQAYCSGLARLASVLGHPLAVLVRRDPAPLGGFGRLTDVRNRQRVHVLGRAAPPTGVSGLRW